MMNFIKMVIQMEKTKCSACGQIGNWEEDKDEGPDNETLYTCKCGHEIIMTKQGHKLENPSTAGDLNGN